MGLQKTTVARLDEVNEGTDAFIVFDIYDKSGNLVPVAQITYAVYTIYDSESQAVINNQQNVNFISTIDSSGHAEIMISGIHNTMVDETKVREKHIASFVISGNDLTTITHKHEFNVLNLHKN